MIGPLVLISQKEHWGSEELEDLPCVSVGRWRAWGSNERSLLGIVLQLPGEVLSGKV